MRHLFTLSTVFFSGFSLGKWPLWLWPPSSSATPLADPGPGTRCHLPISADRHALVESWETFRLLMDAIYIYIYL